MPSFLARAVLPRRDAAAARTGSPRAAWRWSTVVAAACAITGCATSRQPAPVEDRTPVGRPAPSAQPSPAATAPATTPATTPGAAVPTPGTVDPAAKPGAENAGKPGYYTIKPGD